MKELEKVMIEDVEYSYDPEKEYIKDGHAFCKVCHERKDGKVMWTIVNKKDTIFKYIFWERLDSLPIPECCFHFIWC